MKLSRNSGWQEAVRLTRDGQLGEAVDIIQRTLRGTLGQHNVEIHPSPVETPPIEGDYQVIDTEHVSTQPLLEPIFRTESPRRQVDPGSSESSRVSAMPQHMRWPRSGRPLLSLRPVRKHAFDPLPEGAQFVTGSYTNHAGARSYKLYIPSAYDGQALPVVVMLHGCTQDPDDFAVGTRMNSLAERHRCFVLYPAQTPTANGSNCWNWFMTTDQQRDQGEPSIIAGMTRQIINSYRVDNERIYIAGLSAGGAMALVMAMTYPDLYAAIGVHSGLPYAVAHDLPTALALMHPSGGPSLDRRVIRGLRTRAVPAIVFHGDRDTTVHPDNADRVIAQCTTAGRQTATKETKPSVKIERGQIPNGHAYTRTTHYHSSGHAMAEHWSIHGAGHAWSGGNGCGSYTDPKGPDATAEMVRFFYAHSLDRVTP
jgi:poly(hydroxyalkanoate) depolymerase family esterase